MFRSIVTVAATLACALFYALPALADVGITIDGNPVNVSPAPIMQGGRVFVPLRGVFQDLGASVVYSNGQINATGNGTEISLQIGSTQATVNGSPVAIDVAPFIVGESTYVPLRFVSQALGANVSWNDTDQIVVITTGAGAQPAIAQPDSPPPPMPSYVPPPVPAPNYLWMPGYWAWGPAGYFWVPGTWVLAPQTGLYWTPGYWGWQNGSYGWNPGYWANNVGYYGGINYGGGYYGRGYAGGMWSSGGFRYNTAVTTVTNTTIIRNVYVDKTVIVNNTVNHVSYAGGPGGTRATPTASELAVGRAHHVAMTPVQQQHALAASQNHQLLLKVNGGKPPVVVAPHPLTPGKVPPAMPKPVITAKPVAPKPVITAKPVAPKPGITVRPVIPKPVITPKPVIPKPVITARPVPPKPVITAKPVAPKPVITPKPRPVITPKPKPRETPTQKPEPRVTPSPMIR